MRLPLQNGTRLTMKQADFAQQKALGLYNSSRYPDINTHVPCVNGKAIAIPGNREYTFKCNDVSGSHTYGNDTSED